MVARHRLDQALVERGLVASRSLARRLVLAGRVRVDGHPADKPGSPVGADARLAVEQPPRFVSRGGDKIAPVIAASGIRVAGRTCLDVGASTGGFTDCLVQHGASTVVAIDVGYGQLDWKLRQDPRVHVMERTNARHLEAAALPAELAHPIDLVVMDVSFIGVAKVLPAVTRIVAPRSEALILVKPQFEAGQSAVEKGGVVRRAGVRRATLEGVADSARQLGWHVIAAIPSPLRGPAGNWECFLHLRRGDEGDPPSDPVSRLEIPDDGDRGSR